MEIKLLGAVEVWAGGQRLDAGPPQRRAMLAALAVDAGRLVRVEILVDRVWGDRPAPQVQAAVHAHVSGIRRLLTEANRTGADRAAAAATPTTATATTSHGVGLERLARLHRQADGYVLQVDPAQVDLHRFRRLATTARPHDCPDAERAALLGNALDLWRGPALAELPGPWAARMRRSWAEERLDAAAGWAAAAVRLGRYDEVIARLRPLLADRPSAERLVAALMRALAATGRTAEALQRYAEVRGLLAEELGAEPGSELRAAHHEVLVRSVERTPAPAGGPGTGGRSPPVAGRLVPAQLPADVRPFIGRTGELSWLDSVFPGPGRPARAGQATDDGLADAAVCVISGTAGVGKTALAVRWAHRVRARFPDGQLYADLRGYDRDLPMPAADAVARFLRGLGVPGKDIPQDADERAARYRSELAGRRMLIVLDNVATVEDVRPLLPGDASAMVLATSRDSLAGLVARHGAHRLELDLLPPADAVALLNRLIGTRVAAQPQAAAALAAQCARLPLALRVAAELAAGRPTAPLSDLVAELGDQPQRLDLLDAGGDDRSAVTAVLSWSIQHLPAASARAFRLLGLHPGPDFDAYATAALADTSLPQARQALYTLARAHLVQPAGGGRYGMHDLLHAYAVNLGRQEESCEQRRAARTRLFDYYLAAAAAASDTRHPADAHLRCHVSTPGTPVPAFAGQPQALAWLDAERAVLAAGCAYTASHGWPAHTVALAAILFRYLDTGGHYTDAVAVHDQARRAARNTGDRAGEATALTNLGAVDWRQGTYDRAAKQYQQALELFAGTGDRAGEARALSNLGAVRWRQGRYGPAVEHIERAGELYRQIGDRNGAARALTNLGNVQWQQGRYEQAGQQHARALELFRQTGDRDGEAIALNNLGSVHASQGRNEQAAVNMGRALEFYRQLGDRDGIAYALTNLGGLHARQGRHERANSHYRQALALVRQTGNQTGEADALKGLGDVDARQGRYRPAAEHIEHALALYRRTGDKDGQAGAMNALGDTARAAGYPGPALDHHAAALALATDTGDRYQQARAHDGLAHAHRALAHEAPAASHWHDALALFTDLGTTSEAAAARAALTALTAADHPSART